MKLKNPAGGLGRLCSVSHSFMAILRVPWGLNHQSTGAAGREAGGTEVKPDEGVKNPKWGDLIWKLPGICHWDNQFKSFFLFSFF
jgi:hypothetical protein